MHHDAVAVIHLMLQEKFTNFISSYAVFGDKTNIVMDGSHYSHSLTPCSVAINSTLDITSCQYWTSYLVNTGHYMLSILDIVSCHWTSYGILTTLDITSCQHWISHLVNTGYHILSILDITSCQYLTSYLVNTGHNMLSTSHLVNTGHHILSILDIAYCQHWTLHVVNTGYY